MTETAEPTFIDGNGRCWTLTIRSEEELQRIESDAHREARHALIPGKRQVPVDDVIEHLKQATMKMLVRLIEEQLVERGVSEMDFRHSMTDVERYRCAVDAMKQLQERVKKR